MNFLCLPFGFQAIGHELLTEWTGISDVDKRREPRFAVAVDQRTRSAPVDEGRVSVINIVENCYAELPP